MRNRRYFLAAGLLGSVIFVASKTKIVGATTSLQTIKLMQADLFPQAPSNKYILIIFHHSRIDEEEKEYLRNGARWLNEEAVEMYEKPYVSLDAQQRERVLISFSSHDWGESYIHTILSYIMEAYLGDPIYGGNKNGSGWAFLNHEGGKPSPKELYL